MKLWSIEDEGNGNFFWKLEDSFDTSSLKKITLQCNNIEWIEAYLYEDENGQSVPISKNHYFDNGTITIPVESDFKISLFDRGNHQFSIYDLDGKYSFLGGYYEFDPDEDSLIDSYGDDIFEELDNIGTDSSFVILSGKVSLK